MPGDPGAADDGLFARDADGNPQCWDQSAEALANALEAGISPALKGRYRLRVEVPIGGGKTQTVRSKVFEAK